MRVFSILITSLLLSCTEQSTVDVSPSRESTYTPGLVVEIEADYVFKQDQYFEVKVFDNYSSSEYSFLFENLPSELNADSSSGLISGISTSNGIFNNIQAKVIQNNQIIASKKFSLGFAGDPLKKYSWHLSNTGQSTFTSGYAMAGNDINVKNVWARGNTGAGVKIAISDSGLEVNHDDLIENVLLSESRDYNTEPPYLADPTPYDDDGHGTSVAGLISAMGWNNIGGRGVASESQIAGFQFLFSLQDSSILIDQASGDFDIFNYSYGDAVLYDTLSDYYYTAHLRHQVKNARNGLGPIYIKAAGNEHEICEGKFCFPHNANYPYENELPYLMVVGAFNAMGEKASYSNTGSNIWIVAPGGEYGVFDPAIISTDLPTCTRGYSSVSSSLVNDFEYGHSENINCHYTSAMNGTSASTPIASGVVALMLAANQNLSWRDVKHILAVTSKKIDSAQAKQYHPQGYNLTGHNYDNGWVTNATGITFSNSYGFGAIDADEATKMAQSFESLPDFFETNVDFDNPLYEKSNLKLIIPDRDANGVSSKININQEGIAEVVTIAIDVKHELSGQIGVELTSPSGTKSILANINNSFLLSDDADLEGQRLTSNAFYGESMKGDWTIKLIDGRIGEQGQLMGWKINILSH